MLYFIRSFFTWSSLVLFLCAGCQSEKEKVSEDYDNYTFDPKVIEKLPVYDSLASVILKNFPLFLKQIKEDDSYRAFRYMPSSDEVLNSLPTEIAPKIGEYFSLLGKEFIYGFDVFKDSTIKIYIRASYSQKSDVKIWENLSYYPPGTYMRRRELPDKDTILNKNWQYWIRFHKRGLFEF